MRSKLWLGCAVVVALAGLAGCGEQGSVSTARDVGGGSTLAESGQTPAGARAPRPRKPMSDEERAKAVGIKVISAARVEEKKGADRWKVVVRVSNGTDVDIEGVELRATLFPPGTVAPMAMHVREVLFDSALGLDKERLIELEFPAAPSKATVEEIRKEISVGRLVRPITPEAKWQVLDESAITVAKTEPATPPPDPQKELQKVRQQLVRPMVTEPGSDGAGPLRQRDAKG